MTLFLNPYPEHTYKLMKCTEEEYEAQSLWRGRGGEIGRKGSERDGEGKKGKGKGRGGT